MKGEQTLPTLPIRPAKRLEWPSVRTCCADRPGKRLSTRRGRRHSIQSPDPPSVLEAEHPYRVDRDSSLPDRPSPLFFWKKSGPLLTPTFVGRLIPHASAAAQGHRLFTLPPSSHQITQTRKGYWPTYKQQINVEEEMQRPACLCQWRRRPWEGRGEKLSYERMGLSACALPRLPDSS